MIGPLAALGLGKAALVAAATRPLRVPLRVPLLVLHGGAIVATHVMAGAVLGGLGVAVAAMVARGALRPGHHRD